MCTTDVKIKPTEEDVTATSDELNKEFMEIKKAYFDQGIDLYKRLIDFQYQFATMTGIVAGFGFTLYSVVQQAGWQANLSFWIGQVLLLITIIRSYDFVKKVYQAEHSHIVEARERNTKFANEVNGYFESWKRGEIEKSTFKKLKQAANNRNFAPPQSEPQLKTEPQGTLLVFAIGFALLVISLLLKFFSITLK